MADEEPRKQSRTVSVPAWVLVTLGLLIVALVLIVGIVIGGGGAVPQSIASIFASPTPTATPTLTPAQRYAREMASVRDALNSWAFTEYEAVILKLGDESPHYDARDKEYKSYYWLLDFCYNLCPEYAGQGVGVDFAVEYLESDLYPLLSVAHQTGQPIAGELKSITPPDEVRAAHEQLASCHDIRVATLSDWMKLIETKGRISDTVPSGNCDAFDASLKKVNNFIQANQ